MTRMTVNLSFSNLSIDIPFEELDLRDLQLLSDRVRLHRDEGTTRKSAKHWLATKVLDQLEELINEKKAEIEIAESMIRGAAEAAVFAKENMEIGGRQYRRGDAVSAEDIDEFFREHSVEEYEENE